MEKRRLSDIKQYEKGFFLVKFLKEVYLNDLLDGNLYMNNFQYFIDLEKETKEKGQGDKREAGHVFRSTNIRLIDPETNQVIATGSVGEVIERYIGVEKIPVFCMTIFRYSEFEIIEEKEESVVVKLVLPPKDQKNYIETFGEKAVILPHYFLERLEEKNNEEPLGLAYAEVQYHDYDVISSERRTLFDERSIQFFFWKDNFFSNQREFRIVLTQKLVDQPFKLNIGSVVDGAIVVDSEKLFEAEFEFPLNKELTEENNK
ncbi:hypothetical protein [Cytobacillus horneckiae]|uniref:hypothetical protein n=1 Tax=Cytobacillus horneckiae TaxID=549687 RepID=UPI003D1BD185